MSQYKILLEEKLIPRVMMALGLQIPSRPKFSENMSHIRDTYEVSFTSANWPCKVTLIRRSIEMKPLDGCLAVNWYTREGGNLGFSWLPVEVVIQQLAPGAKNGGSEISVLGALQQQKWRRERRGPGDEKTRASIISPGEPDPSLLNDEFREACLNESSKGLFLALEYREKERLLHSETLLYEFPWTQDWWGQFDVDPNLSSGA